MALGSTMLLALLLSTPRDCRTWPLEQGLQWAWGAAEQTPAEPPLLSRRRRADAGPHSTTVTPVSNETAFPGHDMLMGTEPGNTTGQPKPLVVTTTVPLNDSPHALLGTELDNTSSQALVLTTVSSLDEMDSSQSLVPLGTQPPPGSGNTPIQTKASLVTTADLLDGTDTTEPIAPLGTELPPKMGNSTRQAKALVVTTMALLDETDSPETAPGTELQSGSTVVPDQLMESTGHGTDGTVTDGMDISTEPRSALLPTTTYSKKSGSHSPQEVAEPPPDDGIYWQVNMERFHQHFRDQAIVSAVANRMDQPSSEIVRTMLRMSEVTTASGAAHTQPLSSHEIFRSLPPGYNITKAVLEQCLALMADDPLQFVGKSGDSGGGSYSVNLHRALRSLATATLESVVEERFGSRCARIFRLLLRKQHLEQKQVEDFAMIPAKEAKEMLYRMLSENFVSLQEIPRTPDHAPSRTFYLYAVNVPSCARMLLQRCYKSVANLMERRQHETRENKRLLEKSQRVEAILGSMLATGAERAQLQEVEEMITAPERLQLDGLKRSVNKIDASENQVDETIFVLESFIESTVRRP